MAARRKPPRFRAREADPRLAEEVARLRAENEQLRRQQAYSDLSDAASSFNSRTSLSRSYDQELADLRGSNERLLAEQRSLARTVAELRDLVNKADGGKDVFTKFDPKGEGKAEKAKVLEELKKLGGLETLSEKEGDALFTAMDEDNSGTLEKAEWEKFLGGEVRRRPKPTFVEARVDCSWCVGGLFLEQKAKADRLSKVL